MATGSLYLEIRCKITANFVKSSALTAENASVRTISRIFRSPSPQISPIKMSASV